jgi:hypothetical protein
MRKLCTAALALFSALAFLSVGSPSANAFGSEVLGCSFDSGAWTANSCFGGDNPGVIEQLYFVPHNLSGSYTMSWTVTNKFGAAVGNCGSGGTNCISAGCTSTSISCYLSTSTGINDKTFTATLTLTQSGQTRTISATATVYGDSSTCLKC